MDSNQILQSFSTLLFARGAPPGSERLIGKLSYDISSEEALDEWVQGSEDSQKQEAREVDP